MGSALEPPSAAVEDTYDILVLDASMKQSLASIRSLGRAGLRVAAGEAASEIGGRPAVGFCSRYAAGTVVLPGYADTGERFATAVADFAGKHHVRVVLPTSDASIAVLIPWRARLAAAGCTLALPADEALRITNNKDQTLRLAASLGIAYPRTMPIDSEDDLPAVLAAFSFPFVLKPTASWVSEAAVRLGPIEVINRTEAEAEVRGYLSKGARILAQEWANGSREGVTMLVAGGEIVACCAHIVYRTRPALGGVSVMRKSLPVPPDIFAAASTLVRAIGLDGPCEVEFRRDAQGIPLLMEVNARLAGTIENSVRSGFDFPLMIWQWATGQPVQRPGRTRTGIRTRWIGGDVQWLLSNAQRAGRPDSESRLRAQWIFWSEFLRTRYYDCIDLGDLRPIMVQLKHVRTDALQLIGGRFRRAGSGPGTADPAQAGPAGPDDWPVAADRDAELSAAGPGGA
jgi:predicted ATP-grasp superfamily ATP-dependent carboligase